MQKVPYVFPIIGGRKVEHLLANIQALDISLTPEHIAYLESIVPFDPGFPNSFIVRLVLPFLPCPVPCCIVLRFCGVNPIWCV
jgi:hypothetical protein